MNRQEWANMTVAEGSGLDARQLEAAEIISKLGRDAQVRGLLVVPSANEKQVIVHKDSVDGFLTLCQSRGLVGRIVGDFVSQVSGEEHDGETSPAVERHRRQPSPGRTLTDDVIDHFFERPVQRDAEFKEIPQSGARPQPIDWEQRLGLANAVRGAKTREEMMENLRHLQLRAPTSSSVPIHGDIGIAEDGSLKLDDSESRKRLISQETDKVKKAEEEVREFLGSIKVDKSIIQRAADLLLSSSDGMVLKLKAEVNQLSERYNQSVNLVQSSIGIYQAEKFLSESYKALRESINGNSEAKKRRQLVFRQYGKLFGKNTSYYESVFEVGVNTVLEKLESMAPVGKHMEGIIANSVGLAGELEVKKRLLDTSTSGRRTALQKQIEEQFNEIVNFEFVKNLKLVNNSLVIETKNAEINHRNQIWNLGEYLIRVGLTGNRTIHIKNIKWGAKSKYQHPHITDRGSVVCWGSIQKGIKQLQADWNWMLLVQVIWNFLNSYNSDDSYSTVENLITEQGRSRDEATKRKYKARSRAREVEDVR